MPTMTISQQAPGTRLSQRVARAITEIFAPVPLGVIVITFIAWYFAPTTGEAIRGIAIGVLLGLLVPFGYLLRQVRRGRVTDHHVGLRVQRPHILIVFCIAVLIALVALVSFGSPWQLIALIGASMAGLIVALAITLFWKISIHAGVIAGIVVVFIELFGWYMLLLIPLVILVGWARVEVRDHTPPQACAGALIGGAVSGIAFAILSSLLR
jgi:hypothetical protein